MDYKISYLSPTEEMVIGCGRDSDVFIEADTLTGLVGQVEDTGVATIGESGQAVDFGDRKILPTEGGFTLVVKSADAWARARRAFSTARPGTLVITATHRCTLPVRLTQPLQPPGTVPRTGARIDVQLISDGGTWRISNTSAASMTTITNTGDAPIWPRITWQGQGGTVTLPSTAIYTLPAVDTPHTLHTNRRRAGLVVDDAGVDAPQVARQVDVVSEMVPVGQSRTWGIPNGARLEWDVEVLDPWT